MTFDEYEDQKRFRLIHDTLKTLKPSLSPEATEAGISPLEAFISSYDKLNARQVRHILDEHGIGEVDAKALRHAGSARARLSEELVVAAPAAIDVDTLSVALAKIASSDPGTQDRLAAVIRILLIAQITLKVILKAIDLWQAEAARSLVEALKMAGVSDLGLVNKVAPYNL